MCVTCVNVQRVFKIVGQRRQKGMCGHVNPEAVSSTTRHNYTSSDHRRK